jgi:Leucine-rich repeat (LRR) protein
MLDGIGIPFLVQEICNLLPVRAILKLGEVNRATRECVTPILKDTIRIARRALDGIFILPLLDESRLDDCTYCRGYLSRVVKKIDSARGSLRLALEARQIYLEEESQAVKDDNLLEVFEQKLSIEVQRQVRATLSISEKAKIARKFLKDKAKQPELLPDFSRETQVSFINCGLTLIPQELFEYFPNLMCLCLPNNQISVIPDAIGKLGNLERLFLPNNQISVIPDAVGELGNLVALSLPNNQISVIPDAIGKLGNLRTLSLLNNQISVIPDAIEKLGNLGELYLSSNQISAIPDAIGKLGNLHVLNLERNPIKTIPGFFASFRGKLQIDPVPAPAASAITADASTGSALSVRPIDSLQGDRPLPMVHRNQSLCLNTTVAVGILAMGTFLLLRMINAKLI